MRSKGKGLTAVQKRWYDAVASLGSVISGGPAILHHPIGQRGRHDKQECGVWWIIPLTPDEHRDLHAGLNIWEQSHPDMFETRKEFEKGAFKYDVADQIHPVPDEYTFDIHQAIMGYKL